MKPEELVLEGLYFGYLAYREVCNLRSFLDPGSIDARLGII